MKQLPALLLTTCLLGLTACKSTDAATAPASGTQATGTPEEDARALLMGLASAADSTTSCDELVKALDGMVRAESARVSRLASATGPSTGALTSEQETAAAGFVARAKQCAGTPGAARLADSVKPLRTVSAAQSQSCNCNDFCVSGWQTWAEVSAMSLACLGGDNQACCIATAIASESACKKTYCPSDNCCLDVPTSVPPPPAP